MQWKLSLSIFFVLLFSKTALANLAFSSNARTFETQHSTLVMKGLAHSCLTITTIPDGLPCNPAMTVFNKKPNLGAVLLLSNGYSNLDNVRKLLDGKISQDLVDTLFTKGKIIQIETNADINFQSKYLNAQYTPFSLKGFSVVRNEANPDVDLYTLEEKGFLFQSGYEFMNNFYAGVQTRFVDRKFIRKQFKALEIGTEAGKDILKPNLQTAAYIEPGLTWILADHWKPRISAFVANAGFLSKKYEDLRTPVDVQFGLGISPPVYWGIFELSLEYRSLTYQETNLQKLRLGSLYRFGSMYLTGGLDVNGASGGVFYGLEKINAGIMYSTTRFANDNEKYFTQTVYVQLGTQI